MVEALEAMPGAGLVVLLLLAAAAGWGLCRVWDRATFYAEDARDLTVRGGRTFLRGVRRALVLAGVVAGLLFVIALAYQSTH